MADGSTNDPKPHEPAVGDARTSRTTTPHDERHALSVAALLDRDPPGPERAEAERLVASCPDCAQLHAELVSLAAATRALPVTTRPRDFRLTAEDAARLAHRAASDAEPDGARTRLTGEMQVPNADHRAHDQLLVAGLLDRSTDGPERALGEALVAACSDCATLHVDLLALRAATLALPTPRRMRDYTLSAEDARRLTRTGWRRLVAVFGSTRDAFSRPLAIGLTTIGLAGLLVTTVPGALPGASSSASLPTLGQAAGGAGSGANSDAFGGKAAPPAPVASAAASEPGPGTAALVAPSLGPSPEANLPAAPSTEPLPSDQVFDTYVTGPAASAGAAAIAPAPVATTGREGAERTSAASLDQGVSTVDHAAVLILAGLLLAGGLGLFGLRWAGRRV